MTTPPAKRNASYEEMQRALLDSYTGLQLRLAEATEDEQREGMRRFSYRSEEGWAVSGTVRVEVPKPRLLSLEISAATEGGEVSAVMVRNVPVGKIVASLQTLLQLDQMELTPDDPHWAEGGGYKFAALPAPLKPVTDAALAPGAPIVEPGAHTGGRPPLSDDLLREVAERYLAETAEDKPPRPIGRLAEHFGRPEQTLRTWVARARKDGWLGPAIKGRAGAEPGPRLMAWQLDQLKRNAPGLISHVLVDPEGNAKDVSEPGAYEQAQQAGGTD